MSSIPLLNLMVPNGGISLDWAFEAYRKGKFTNVTDAEGDELFSKFLGAEVRSDMNLLKTTSPASVAAEGSHVVFVIMESMSQHLLQFDSAERDLLGRLRKHWESDIVFERFLSESNGTISSLVRLMVRSPMAFLSQSVEHKADFDTNMLKPYIDNGYKIVFITSGSGTWQNIGSFLPNIGVSEFVESNLIKKRYPEAQMTPWGVPDEYLFRYAEERLENAEKNKEKLLMIMLTVSFHPPYKVPRTTLSKKFNYTDAELSRLANLRSTGGVPDDVFSTFRYVNDEFGGFIDYIKSSNLSDKTVIAATGDHNIRGIGYNETAELALGFAVPFYLYYKEASHGYDKYQPSSHKDIWPTLYNLTLPSVTYFRSGCDLLSESNPSWCFGANDSIIIDNDGALYKNVFYPWIDKEKLLLNGGKLYDARSDSIPDVFNRYAAYEPLLKWLSNKQVQEWKSRTRIPTQQK